MRPSIFQDSIRTHGEMAVSQAQLGQRQTDIGAKIAVPLWFVLAVAFALFSVRNGFEETSAFVFWGGQIVAVAISVGAGIAIEKVIEARIRKKEEEYRRAQAAERQRQLEEFIKGQNK